MFNIVVNNEKITIRKNYYFDLAGILNDNKLRKSMLNKNESIKKIYEQLSRTNLKTSNINKVIKYTNIVTKNWSILWDYYKNKTFNKLKYKKYIKSKIAISRISKELINKCKEKNKKLLFLMGNGNGNMTVSNTKNSSSAGPIKRIVSELALKEVVVYVDEYKTSKLCNCCEEEIDHVYCLHYSSNKCIKKNPSKEMLEKIDEYSSKENTKLYDVEEKINVGDNVKEKLKIISNMNKKEDISKEQYVEKLIKNEKKKLMNNALEKIDNNKEEVKKMHNESRKKIEEKKKEIRTHKYMKGKRREEMLNHKSYGLVRCKNEACKGYAKLTNRDENACNGIGKIGIKKMLNKDLGKYKREIKNAITKIYESD